LSYFVVTGRPLIRTAYRRLRQGVHVTTSATSEPLLLEEQATVLSAGKLPVRVPATTE
jgi:hypothetical protein